MSNQIKLPGFVAFISSPAGRLIRVLAGIALIGVGLNAASINGYIVAAIGIIPLLAGAFDVCILGGLLGGPYKGNAIRLELHRQTNQPELGTKSASFIKA